MFQITFKIQKQVKFGQGVFVIGNLPEIGSWIVAQGFRLNWNQDHIWQGTVTFDAKTLKKLRRIQYKYIIASWQNPQNQSIQWEIGQQNRLIDVNFLENQSKICDQWNMSKLKIHLITKKPLKDQNSLKYRYSMIGNCTQLGNWKIRKGLRLQQNLHSKIIRKLSENIPKTDILKFLKNQLIFDVYFTQLTIPRDQNKFSYYFVRQNDKIQIERHPGRVYSLNVEKYPHRNSIIYEPGFTGIYDEQNFDKPTLSKITPQIYLGSYLKTEKDLQYLKNLGIQAIYSIQTEQDHEDNGISPLYLELLCKQYEIILKKIQIQDRNSRDFVQKSKTAVEEIDQLVRMGKPTYVYCSAGKYRSPQMVALYLTLKNGLNVSDAIKFIQDRHPVARPNEKTIKTAIYHITHFNLGSPVKQTVENRAN